MGPKKTASSWPFPSASPAAEDMGGTKARHRALLQTTALVGLARHSSSGQLNLKESLQTPARGKRQGVAQVCRAGAGGRQLSQASKHMRPAAQSPCSSQQASAWSWTQMDGSTRARWAPFQVCAPRWAQVRAYQGRHVPSVHLATGDLQLRLRHRAHLKVFWPSSPCPHDGWQGHRAQLRLAYTVKLLLQDGRPETERNTRSRDVHGPSTRLCGSAATEGLTALPPDMLCCKLGWSPLSVQLRLGS